MADIHTETKQVVRVIPWGMREIGEILNDDPESRCLSAAILGITSDQNQFGPEKINPFGGNGSNTHDAVNLLATQTSLITFGGTYLPKEFGTYTYIHPDEDQREARIVTVPVAPLSFNLNHLREPSQDRTDVNIIPVHTLLQLMCSQDTDNSPIIESLQKTVDNPDQNQVLDQLTDYLAGVESEFQQKLLRLINLTRQEKPLQKLAEASPVEMEKGLRDLEVMLSTESIRMSERSFKEVNKETAEFNEFPPDTDTLRTIMGLTHVEDVEKIDTILHIQSREVIQVIREWRGVLMRTLEAVSDNKEPVTKKNFVARIRELHDSLEVMKPSQKIDRLNEINARLFTELGSLYGLEAAQVKDAFKEAQDFLFGYLNAALNSSTSSEQIYDLANEVKNENPFRLVCLAMGLNLKDVLDPQFKRFVVNQSRQILCVAEKYLKDILPLHNDYEPQILNEMLRHFASPTPDHITIANNSRTVHSLKRKVTLMGGEEIHVIVDEGLIKDSWSTLRKGLSSNEIEHMPEDIGRVSFVLVDDMREEKQRMVQSELLLKSFNQKAQELFGDAWDIKFKKDDKDPFELSQKVLNGGEISTRDIRGKRNGSKASLLLRNEANLIFTHRETGKTSGIEVVVFTYPTVQMNEQLQKAGFMGYLEKIEDDANYSTSRWTQRDSKKPLRPVIADLLLWLLPFEKLQPLFYNKRRLQHA